MIFSLEMILFYFLIKGNNRSDVLFFVMDKNRRICLVKLRRKIRSNLFILISITINILIKLNRVNIVKLSKEVRLNLGQNFVFGLTLRNKNNLLINFLKIPQISLHNNERD